MNLAEIIWILLPPGQERSIAHLVAELELEYPEEWQEIQRRYREEFGLSRCGVRQSPRTAVSVALEQLAACGLVEPQRRGQELLWRRKMP